MISSGSRPPVVVVGGGISGLAAAYRLVTSAGAPQVVLLEQAPRTGGVLRRQPFAVGSDEFHLDVGAEALLARRPEATDLLHEIGLGDDVVHPVTSRAAIWSRGCLHPMPAGTVMGVPGDPDALRGLLSGDEVEAVAAEADRTHEPVAGDVDVASWVAGRVGQAVVDRLVEPLLGGVYAGHAARLSLRATVPALWPVARDGTGLLEAVRRAKPAGTAAGDDGAAPVFAGVRGGVGRLAETLHAQLVERGTRVLTGACVQRLERRGEGWALHLGPAGRGDVIEASAVVLAVPAQRAARLLSAESPSAATLLGEVASSSMVVCTVVTEAGTLDGLDLSGVLVPPVEDRLVKAVTFSSRKWAWVAEAAGGRDVLRMSVGRSGEEQVLQRPDDDLLALAVRDVEHLLARPVPVVASTVTRWGGALPQYEVGHVERVVQVREHVSLLPGIALAGSTYDGLGVPACIAGADRAVAEVLAAGA